MKIINLAIIFMLNLLSFKIFNKKFTEYMYKYFKGLNNARSMEQGEGNAMEEHENEPENIMENGDIEPYQNQYVPLQNIAVDEIGANVEYADMEVADDSSDENDDDDENSIADEDDDSSNYRELEELWMTSSSDESDMLSDVDSQYGGRTFKQMWKHCIRRQQELKKPEYTFKPLRLIKCLYKHRHDLKSYPIARSGHRITASESHLYSLGGYNPNSRTNTTRRGACMLFQELWSFNFATNRWKLLQNADNVDMPKELASNALVIYNNVLISHGGTGYPFGETCSNDCYVYTTSENPQIMLLKTSGDLPAAQYGPGIVIHKDYLYTIGGTTGFDYSCDVYRLNLTTKVWENVYICRPEMRDDPEGRYRHEVVYDGHHIYVLGGGTAHAVYDLQRIPAFNLEKNHWDYFETLPDRSASSSEDPGFPKARKCLSCVQHTLSNGDIEAFITGGLQDDFTTYFNDIWKLNLRTKQWRKIHCASLPRPLYFHSAAHSGNGCMYIFGGIEYTEKDMCRRNDLFKMWMTIPKLSDICWDAITYYNSDLHHFDRNTLLSSGIPNRFLNRLPLPQERIRKHLPDDTDEPSPSSLISAVPKRMRS